MTRRSFPAIALLLSCAAPLFAEDSMQLGGRVGLYTKHDQPYFGVELVLPVGSSLCLEPNVEYVRLGDNQQFTINADLAYQNTIKKRTVVWAGLGVGLVSTHPDGPAEPSSKDGVGNVFAGVGFQAGPTLPYLTVKYMAKQHPEFLIGLGIRF
jgi:hypothetical protein